jgi:hypothetical protein
MNFNNVTNLILAMFMTSMITYFVCNNSNELKNQELLSIYLSGDKDIMHINLNNNEIYFESKDSTMFFATKQEMYNFISEITAFSSTILGYQEDLRFLSRKGYIKAKRLKNTDVVDITYSGPMWSVNTSKNTDIPLFKLEVE